MGLSPGHIDGALRGSTDRASRQNLQESILSTTLSAAHAVRTLLGLRLAALGLAAGQDRFLLALVPRGRLTVSTLADELAVRPSTVSKTADRLVDKGLVTRLLDESDARRIILELTPAGLALCRKVAEIGEEIDAELTASLAPNEVTHIQDSLSLLERTAHRRLRRLR